MRLTLFYISFESLQFDTCSLWFHMTVEIRSLRMTKVVFVNLFDFVRPYNILYNCHHTTRTSTLPIFFKNLYNLRILFCLFYLLFILLILPFCQSLFVTINKQLNKVDHQCHHYITTNRSCERISSATMLA